MHEMTASAPIAIFIYNRTIELQQMLATLVKCKGFDSSPLFVFGDGPKNPSQTEKVEAARALIQKTLGDRATYRFSTLNKGLKRSLIEGVQSIVNEYDRVIVLEDDLFLASNFLIFMNEALETYVNDENVYMVSGHSHEIPELRQSTLALLLPFISTLGWGTWKRAWQKFDEKATGSDKLMRDRSMQRRFNLGSTYDYTTMLKRQLLGLGNSWGIPWYWTVFKADGLVVYPPQTLVYNVGMNTAGTNGYGRIRKFASSYDPTGKIFSDRHYTFPEAKLDQNAFAALKKTLWHLNGGIIGWAVDIGKSINLRLTSGGLKK